MHVLVKTHQNVQLKWVHIALISLIVLITLCCYTLCLLVYLVSSQLEQVLSTSLSLNIYFLKMVQTVHTPTKNIQTSIS